MIITSESKTMRSPTKEAQKPPVKLSFSISRILGDTDDKKRQTIPTEHLFSAEAHRVPHIGTVHHFAHEAVETSQLDISGQPRACSTPENEEYPSPTPTYYPVQHGFHVPHSHPLSYHTSPTFYSHGVGKISLPETPPTDLPLKPSVKCLDSLSDKSLDSLGESYHHSPSPLKMKKKKTRTVFSRSQIYQLESAFDLKRYLSSAERAGLAARLNLSETQIKIWFQNRRNKWKRQINGEMDEIPIPPGFAAGFLSQQPYCTPSLNSVSHVIDTSEELLRSRLAAPYNYAHPYSQEHRRPISFLH